MNEQRPNNDDEPKTMLGNSRSGLKGAFWDSKKQQTK
jgi:hypothetical protein